MPITSAPHRFCRTSLRCWSLALILLLSSVLMGCGDSPLVRQESFVFGTRVEVVTFGTPEAQARAALSEVLREFDRLHRTYHAWQPSELMTLNAAFARGETQPITPEMRKLLIESRRFAEISDGLFDPAIGKLIALWGFHSDTFAPAIPNAVAVLKLVAEHPSVRDLQIGEKAVSSRNPAVELDLGGIAKGYALDRAAAMLHSRGIKSALINIGGNILALGAKGDTPWTVGIQHPRASGPMATLALYDGEAVGTSGDYQRFFEVGGKRYSHLLDPRSGQPAQHTQAVTVLITPQENAGLLSDVTSKPILLRGDGWRDMAKRVGVEHVLRVNAAGRIAVTEALRARLRWQEGSQPDEVVQ